MHPFSPALDAMVKRKIAQAQLVSPAYVEPTELERRLRQALGELARTRPRIVAFAPDVALRRALTTAGVFSRRDWSPESAGHRRVPSGV